MLRHIHTRRAILLLPLVGLSCSPRETVTTTPPPVTVAEGSNEAESTIGLAARNLPTPAFVVTPVEIANEFAANPEQTKRKYEGKWLQMTGPLGYDSMRGTSERWFGTVDCYFGADFGYDTKEWQYVKPRLITAQETTIIGKCVSIAEGTVQLSNCMLVDVGPDPTGRVTAAEITSAFAEDLENAKARFHEKPFEVQGTISRIDKEDDAQKIHLAGHKEGEGALTVEFGTSGPAYFDVIDKHKVGDVIRVRGDVSYSLSYGKHIYLSYAKLLPD